jgi:hypothetical protein
MKDPSADRAPKRAKPARRSDRNDAEHSGKGSASALNNLKRWERTRALLRGERDKPS